jgi:hypothetical protein
MDQWEGGGARMGRAGGARGARAGPDRAGLGGLGHITDRNPRHARPLNEIRSRIENPKRNETNTRHQTEKCASA